MAYFTMWWKEQSPSMKDKVKELVKNHQLSFANGGWCMHDEATTHFMGMIDQTTRGHDFLKTTFDGYTPRKFFLQKKELINFITFTSGIS
jgi:alpha-mannosidase